MSVAKRGMFSRAIAAGLRAASCAVIVVGAPASAWAQTTPLPTDPRIISGELDNGLAYKVLRHANPPGRAALYMHVDSGSLNETDTQRGIAHYLEHMAFNGSKNFPPGSVIDFFQSLGMTFGQHQNAFTSFEQTTYILELPDNTPETLGKGLLFFSDVAGRLLLVPKEIDEERQVIMREKQSRLGAQQRVQEYVFKRLAPGSTFGERLPIGTEETILGVQEPDFRDYYGHYYVPSNMTLMIVADMEPTAVIEQIKKNYGDLGGGAKQPRPADREVGVKLDTAPRAIVATDKELTRATVSIEHLGAARPPSTTVADARRDLVEHLGAMAFNRRIEAKVNAGTTAFLNGSGGVQSLFHVMTISSAQATCEPAKWKESLQQMGEEVARANKFGFNADELADARKEFIADLEEAVATEATRSARAILSSWNNDVAAGEPIMSAAQNIEVMKPLVTGITPEEVSAAFKANFAPHMLFVVQLPTSVAAPSESDLIDLGMKAVTADVQAEATIAKVEKLLDKEPSGGKVAEGALHDASGVWSGWLSNNLRVHHRFMDYKKNEVTVAVTLLGGEIAEDAKTRGLTAAALNAWMRPATSTLTSTNIRDLMTGKKVNVGGRPSGADQVTLNVSGNPEDLETGMQLAYLLLTDPKIEEAALSHWQTQRLQAIAREDKEPQGYFQRLVAKTVFPVSDVRTQPLTKEQVEAVKLADAQAWLKKLIAEAPIEVTVVGDLRREKALELVTKYLGSLASRPRVSPETNAALRKIAKPKQDRTAVVEFPTETPQAIVLAAFFGPDERDLTQVRRMRMAARALTTRMINQIREKEQLVYSVGANVQPGSAFPGWGMVLAAAPTQPDRADKLSQRLHEVFAEFGQGGPSDEEMQTVKKQIANQLDESMKEPAFWIQNTRLMTYEDKKIDDVLSAPAAYQAITAAEIKEAFNTYYTPDSKILICVKPRLSEGAKPDAAKPDAKRDN